MSDGVTGEFVFSLGAVLPFVALAVSAFLGAYVFGLNPRGPANRSVLLVMLAFVMWDVGEAIQRSFAPGTSTETLFFWARFTWVAIVLVPATLYQLAITYPAGSGRFRRPWLLAAIYAPFVGWASPDAEPAAAAPRLALHARVVDLHRVRGRPVPVPRHRARDRDPRDARPAAPARERPELPRPRERSGRRDGRLPRNRLEDAGLVRHRSRAVPCCGPPRTRADADSMDHDRDERGAHRAAERARLRARPHGREVPPRESGDGRPPRRPRLPRDRGGLRPGCAIPQTRPEPGERLAGNGDRRGGPGDVHRGAARRAPRLRGPSPRHRGGARPGGDGGGRSRPHDDHGAGRPGGLAARRRAPRDPADDGAPVESASPLRRSVRCRLGHGPSGSGPRVRPAEGPRRGGTTGDCELRIVAWAAGHRPRRPRATRLVRRHARVASVHQGFVGHRGPARMPVLPDRRTGGDPAARVRDALPPVRHAAERRGAQELSSFRADHNRC